MKLISFLQHDLTEDQQKELGHLGMNPVHFRDMNPELWEQLKNSPGNELQITTLAAELAEEILEDLASLPDEKLAVLLPIGSPAFMFCLAVNLYGYRSIVPVFAHSERSSVDDIQQGGSVIKRSVFKHSHFIWFDEWRP